MRYIQLVLVDTGNDCLLSGNFRKRSFLHEYKKLGWRSSSSWCETRDGRNNKLLWNIGVGLRGIDRYKDKGPKLYSMIETVKKNKYIENKTELSQKISLWWRMIVQIYWDLLRLTLAMSTIPLNMDININHGNVIWEILFQIYVIMGNYYIGLDMESTINIGPS